MRRQRSETKSSDMVGSMYGSSGGRSSLFTKQNDNARTKVTKSQCISCTIIMPGFYTVPILSSLHQY